jgi:CRP-like cAMP-binding protein
MGQLEKGPLRSSAGQSRGRAQRAAPMRAAFARCAPFSVLSGALLDDLVEACRVERFPRRGLLYEQGRAVDNLYVVVSGRVRVARAANDGRTLTVAYCVPCELLGETALPDAERHRATAMAIESVEAVRVPVGTVRILLTQSPALSQAMLGLMIERRLEAERRVESLLSRSVESRVAEFLLAAAERSAASDARGVLIGVRYTHQEIADYVGSTRETITLTLGELRKQDLLLFDHRHIIIPRLQDLAKRV